MNNATAIKPELATEMKQYLSYGGGVNSTALLILMTRRGMDFEAVYVDHGCDWPETRDFVGCLQVAYPITIIRPDVQGFDNIYDYGWRERFLPSRLLRWCTDKFKVTPLNKYMKSPCTTAIGIDAGEAKRAKPTDDPDRAKSYPLIDMGINRDGCKKIISDAGLPMPIKSGCWFCPFQRRSQWVKLQEQHPDLFCKAIALESRVNDGRKERGKFPIYLTGDDKSIAEVVRAKGQRGRYVANEQDTIFESIPPCSCGL